MGVRRQVTDYKEQPRESGVGRPESRVNPQPLVPEIEVHIEELVLHGFDPRDRRRIGDAVERELGRLLGEQGLRPELVRDVDVASLEAVSFKVTAGARPERVGRQIAGAIHQRLGQCRPSDR